MARAGEGGGGGDPRDDPTALKDGDLSLGYAYARTLPPTVALTNNNPGAIPGSSWGRPTPVGVYGTHREVYHNILSREEEYGGGGGGGAQQHAAPPHVDFHHRSSLHGAQLHQAASYEASLKREVHRSSEDPAAAAAGLRGTNFDQQQEEEEEGSSNSGSVGKGTRGNHPSSSVVQQQQQSWALAVREVDEGATQGMNVQSLQQHNPATASVHVGPSEPDNHLHLHGMNSTLSCPLIAPPSLPIAFFFSLTISLALQEVVHQGSFSPIPALLMMVSSASPSLPCPHLPYFLLLQFSALQPCGGSSKLPRHAFPLSRMYVCAGM